MASGKQGSVLVKRIERYKNHQLGGSCQILGQHVLFRSEAHYGVGCDLDRSAAGWNLKHEYLEPWKLLPKPKDS